MEGKKESALLQKGVTERTMPDAED
jgi:hypothetical protein